MKLPTSLPFTPHEPTIHILDSTKARSYMQCPRDFLLRYCFGWIPELPDIHLSFGSAWHEAMEHLLLTDYSQKEVLRAYEKFEASWLHEVGTPLIGQQISSGSPKNPDHAYLILSDYASHYARDRELTDVVATEIACEVLIREDQTYTTKLDAVLRNRKTKQLVDFEHKTGSRLTDHWKDKWRNSLQLQGYDYALNVSFPGEVLGTRVNGAIIGMPTKANPDKPNWTPIRPLIVKTDEMRHAWLFNINYWLARIEQDFALLSQETPEQKVLFSFPSNSEACEHRFGCDFPDICPFVANPLALYHECNGKAPPGYKQKHWNPRTHGKVLLEEGTFKEKPSVSLGPSETDSEAIISGTSIKN